MKAIKLITMLVVSTTLMACESMDTKVANQIAESGATALTADEIRTTMSGNSVYEKGKTSKGNPMQFTGYYQDGTMKGRAWGSGWDETDTGTWKATENNEFCRMWSNWRDGKEGCFKLYRLSDTEIAWEAVSGAGSMSISSIEPGNPYEL